MTDVIVSIRELKGLARAKEVFEGEPPEGVIVGLGDWEFERMGGGFFLQSGVYHLHHKNGEPQDRMRGSDPKKFVLKKPLRDLLTDNVLPEWRRVLTDKEDAYRLEIELRNYVTAGAACASEERFKLIGRWANIKRVVDIHNVGVKRTVDKCFSYYYSTKPMKGVIDQTFVKEVAKELNATPKDVAACLRAGEALSRRRRASRH